MGASGAILATLVAYHLALLGIGVWAARRTRGGEDFHLGGRGLGPWVAALSSAASSSSAWTLLGVSGAAWGLGLAALWLFPACLGGFALNWYLVAGRLRRASVREGSLTLLEFLAGGLPPPWRRRFLQPAAAIVLLSLGAYVASQFQAAGKTFAASLDVETGPAVVLGAVLILAYTLLGGFWAVSLTDCLQGLVMAAASVLVPGAALLAVGGPAGMLAGLREAGLDDPFGASGGLAAGLGLVAGFLGIGLGYPGQPHVVNRFMALRSEEEVARGRRIALGWAMVIYSGMLVTGWCARSLLDPGLEDREQALILLTSELFPPVVAGVIVAAVLSAIMSTADSQLLVCASTLSHDLGRRGAGGRAVLQGRLAVLAVTAAATVAALLVEETIFRSVLFAWSGLGAAFGPLLLVRLLRGPVRPPWSLAAMLAGFAVSVVWYETPALKARMYELVPAFLVALVLAVAGSRRARSA